MHAHKNNFFLKKSDLIFIRYFNQNLFFNMIEFKTFVNIVKCMALKDRGLFDQNSLDQNCVFHLIKSFNNESFIFYHLIELFHMFSVDQKFY